MLKVALKHTFLTEVTIPLGVWNLNAGGLGLDI